MTHSRARYLGLAPPGVCQPSGSWTIWSWDGSGPPQPVPSPGSGGQGGPAWGVLGACGLLQEDMVCRAADWPWLSLQRKASTTSVSCATRCSTPRPSSSVTSSSTASRAWAAPSNVPCASQVSVPGGEHVGRGKGPRGPALHSLALSIWPNVAPELTGKPRGIHSPIAPLAST